jgi:hypothetical protein
MGSLEKSRKLLIKRGRQDTAFFMRGGAGNTVMLTCSGQL